MPNAAHNHTDEYMSDAQLNAFKHRLLEEKSRLSEIAKTQLDEAAGMLTPCCADSVDQAQYESTAELSRFQRGATMKQISSINVSLRAIDTGDYGYCRTCGIEIGIPRLNANPTATDCIECQTIGEKTRRIHAS